MSFCVFAAAIEAAPSFASGSTSVAPVRAEDFKTDNEPAVKAANPLVATPIPAVADEIAPAAAEADFSSLRELVAAEDVASPLSADEECLAGAVYFESRNESLEGQHAVADVVINRSESGRFPRSICGVVYQPSQFSFIRGGRMPAINRGSTDWHEAVAVARVAIEDRWQSAAPKALFFHATRVSPRWNLTRVATVGNHVFYR